MKRQTLLIIAAVAVAGYFAYRYYFKKPQYPILDVFETQYAGNTVKIGNAKKKTFKDASGVKAYKANGEMIAKGPVKDPKTDKADSIRADIAKEKLEKASYLTKA